MRKRAIACAARIGFAATLVVAVPFAPGVHAQSQAPFPIQAYERLIQPVADYLTIPHFHQKLDFFGGIDAAHPVAFAWMGATYAPFGTLAEDGWRIRGMAGAGRYSYRTPLAPGGINDANVFSAEVLAGYRKTFNNIFGKTLYVGAFAGVQYEDQMLVFADPFNAARGSEAGIKGSLEVYSRIAQHVIATAFASASSVHQKYYAKGNLLYELNETWAVGGEVATMGDARYTEHRLGLAGSLTWRRKIFMLSAGALENSGRGDGIYTTLSVYSPF